MGSVEQPNGSGLPVPNPCLSFWQQTTRSFAHLHANQGEPVPASSRYVVIGSGLSGALTAYSLIEGGVSAADILILEAREAASGASSRNAGHVRPDAFRGFQVYQALHGADQALKIIANERAVLHAVDAFVARHGVACDFAPAPTFDVCMTPEFAAFNARSLRAYAAAGGDVSHVRFHEADEARRRTRVVGAVAAYEWPAGSAHPAKLAQWLLGACIEMRVRLFTHCPAVSVSRSPSSPSSPSCSATSEPAAAAAAAATEVVNWAIHTPRGTITTPTVIHCTNAFAPHLLPQLSGSIIPNRAQAHAFVPPPSLSAGNALQSTLSLRHGLTHFYSVAQRRSSTDGVIILGAPRGSPNVSEAARAGRLSPDDGVVDAEVRDDAVANFEACFPDCEAGRLRPGEGLLHAWTGIIGVTPDAVPFVGRVGDEMPGHWICAGFNGHGMARIFTCAPGLAKLVLGGTWADTGLPECFEMTEKRLERLKQGVSGSGS
ncbi:FAD dependent oxidoreductase [Xylariomycetidae sp. FL2044]|nr:FAD dependent oxidoreductase [Xylariomycetidae sp. FL2044]